MWLILMVVFSVGCDAEKLGVRLPRGGISMMNQATIKRDLWHMTDPRIGGRVPGSSGARRVAKYIARRMGYYGLKPAFEDGFRRNLGPSVGEMICGVKPGSGEQAVVVAALDPGIGTVSAIPITGLLSLVATFQGPDAPMHSLYFCVIPQAGGLKGFVSSGPVPYQQVLESFTLGTLTGTKLRVEHGPVLGPVRSRLLHSGPLTPGISDDIGQLDYGTILKRLEEVYSLVASVD
jgi:hypothetical protein